MYWNYDAAENTWYLMGEDEDGERKIGEVGLCEDAEDGYYAVDLTSASGWYGFDTVEEAKADIEAYFKKVA